MPTAVAMGAYAGSQPHHFGDQIFSRQVFEIGIHQIRQRLCGAVGFSGVTRMGGRCECPDSAA
jgi:hypothetical protein